MEVQVCIHFQLDLERGKAQQIQNIEKAPKINEKSKLMIFSDLLR